MLIVNYEIGDMPKGNAYSTLVSLKTLIEKYTDDQVIVSPTSHGVGEISLSSDKDTEHLVINLKEIDYRNKTDEEIGKHIRQLIENYISKYEGLGKTINGF